MYKQKLGWLFWLLVLASGAQGWAQPSEVNEEETGETYQIAIFPSAPMSFLDAEGVPQGMIIDLFDRIAAEEGIIIEWIFDDWAEGVARIRGKEIDLITAVGYSDERAEFMEFAENSFINVWGQVFLPADSSVESIFDLNNKKIGVLRGGINGQRFRSQCVQFEVDCEVIDFDSYLDAFQAMSQGEIDASVSHNLVGYSSLDDYNMIASAIVFDPFKAYVAAPKRPDNRLLNIYDQYMARWKEDPGSFYYQTRMKWLNPETDVALPRFVLYLILSLLVFSIIAAVFAFLLKRQVNLRVHQLSSRQQQMNQIINLVPHMIYVTDVNGRVILANKTAGDYFGMSVEEFEGCNIKELHAERADYENLLNGDANLYENATTPIHREIRATDHDGEDHILYLSKMPFQGRDHSEPAVVTVAVDITDVKKFEEKIKFMAQHDSLTDLPNRLLLKDRISRSLALSQRHGHNGAILFIDLDFFKNINDSQGHRIGDLLLKDVALRLTKCIRAGDTLARLGGDEFIVALPALSDDEAQAEAGAKKVGQKILDVIAQPFQIDEVNFHISASIGIVLYPRDGTNQDVLLQRADTAMYEAKANGRNRVQVFNNKLEQAVIQKLELENELRKALERDQLFILYQPVVKGPDAKVVGSEALLRWRHPAKGVINPVEFIWIAEQGSLINEIGTWVLEEACKKIRERIEAGKSGFFISVNLSVNQIEDEDFYDTVSNLIHQYQIPMNHLELEVTESVLMNQTKRSYQIFKKLKLLGIRISIDDFGKGYSSFDYLMKLPLDKIKIDRSFVKNLPDDANSATIVIAILHMARELKMDVVAEGIETREQFEFLLSKECECFQGFYFHRPVPYEEVVKIAGKS